MFKTLSSLLELNQMEQRPIRPHVMIEGNINDDESYHLITKPSYADHPLVVGPRYTVKNIAFDYVNYEGYHTSGLVIYGIGPEGVKKARRLKYLNYLKSYEIEGEFGKATNNFFHDGIIRERTTAKKASMIRPRFNHFIQNMVASYRTNMIRSMGLEPDSQSAYKLLAAGPVRPIANRTDPLIYNMQCTSFKVPNFTIEVQALNVNELYLGNLIHTLGYKMRSTAFVNKLRCLSIGKFNLDHTILEKYLNVQSVLENIEKCKDIFDGKSVESANVTKQ